MKRLRSLINIKGDSHHRDIDRIAGGLRPSDAAFPYDKLREYTDASIRKLKGIKIPEGLDEYLTTFILEHGRREVALAASAHSLSRECTQQLLKNRLHVSPGNFDDLETYAECIIACSRSPTSAISRDEAERAQDIFAFVRSIRLSPARVLQPAIDVFLRGISLHSLLRPHYVALLEAGARAYQEDLMVLRLAGHWKAAHALSSWLAHVLPAIQKSQSREVQELAKTLEATFPSWFAWATWTPHKQAIEMFADRIDAVSRNFLCDLIALEGPSFRYPSYSTMREGLAARASSPKFQYGKAMFSFAKSDPQYLTQQLRKVTYLILQTAAHDDLTDSFRMRLTILVLTGREISEQSIRILEVALACDDLQVIKAIIEMLEAFDAKRGMSQSDIVVLLKACKENIDLNQLFGKYVRDNISQVFTRLQSQLRTSCTGGQNIAAVESSLLVQLHMVGKDISANLGFFEGTLTPKQNAILKQWPAWWQVSVCEKIMKTSQAQQSHILRKVNHLQPKVMQYLLERMVDAGTITTPDLQLVESLMGLWHKGINLDAEAVAIIVAQAWEEADTFFQCRCIDSLLHMPKPDVTELRKILEHTLGVGDACRSFAHLLIQCEEAETIAFWKQVLLRIIEKEGDSLMDWAIAGLTSRSWLNWLENLFVLFVDVMSPDSAYKSPFLDRRLHVWAGKVAHHKVLFKRLEEEPSLKSGYAIGCLLRGGEVEVELDLQRILDHLDSNFSVSKWPILVKVAARLDAHGKNVDPIRRMMNHVKTATVDGEEALLHILETYEEVSPEAAEMMIHAWKYSDDLMPMDKLAVETLSSVLSLDADADVPMDSLKATQEWMQQRYEELILEAQRLESLRLAWKQHNPTETAQLLEQLGIENSSPVDDLMDDLPNELIDVIERVADGVEMTVPLNGMTQLQLRAMGAGAARNLLVRFSPGFSGMTPSFCLHFDTEDREIYSVSEHSPCLVLDGEPEDHSCFGRMTPAVYQMSRILTEWIQINQDAKIGAVYNFIVEEIKTMASKCIVCGVLHGYKIRRSTLCADKQCLETFKKAHIDVRLADIRADPAGVDLMMTAVYATARSNNNVTALLANCPIQNYSRLMSIIDSIPAIKTLQNSQDLSLTLSSDATRLMAWACNAYRGFLCTAPPALKVPSFPGAHQFVMINASPAQEIAFATKVKNGGGRWGTNSTTRVMFHGTTMERLNAILREGLRDLSGSALQRNGQTYGKGIYLSTEPSTAWGYTYASQSWRNSTFNNMRVLLGIELAGSWTANSGNIHVITDPACVMVRYVFLCPNLTTMPIANHVVPAMTSAFASIRNGVV